ncbi:unnamed protein product [Paramecium sonneborni]|uniref:Uncharacterized protein n=1 Tax=Paramecium sonneborni TaxID=65129 RepID=A0A8S1NI57_9CILI|nr:unnamed protein product [Paramecium sonneborni]
MKRQKKWNYEKEKLDIAYFLKLKGNRMKIASNVYLEKKYDSFKNLLIIVFIYFFLE